MTNSAPIFFSAIKVMASKTVELGVTDQMVEPFSWRIEEIVPEMFMWDVELVWVVGPELIRRIAVGRSGPAPFPTIL